MGHDDLDANHDEHLLVHVRRLDNIVANLER
jgi:hypothetical protein